MVGALLACFAAQNVFDSSHQGQRHERFLNEVPTVVENKHGAVWVCGHQYDAHRRPLLLQFFGEVGPGHTRHRHITKQQIYGSRELCFDLNRFFCAGGSEHCEMRVFQYSLDELKKKWVVFYDENSLKGCLSVLA